MSEPQVKVYDEKVAFLVFRHDELCMRRDGVPFVQDGHELAQYAILCGFRAAMDIPMCFSWEVGFLAKA